MGGSVVRGVGEAVALIGLAAVLLAGIDQVISLPAFLVDLYELAFLWIVVPVLVLLFLGAAYITGRDAAKNSISLRQTALRAVVLVTALSLLLTTVEFDDDYYFDGLHWPSLDNLVFFLLAIGVPTAAGIVGGAQLRKRKRDGEHPNAAAAGREEAEAVAPPPYDLKAVARHVDREMASLLELQKELSLLQSHYPPVVWHAMRTAYAAHFRNLLEFFHGRRPPGKKDKLDARYADYLGRDRNKDPLGIWMEAEKRRMDDADKLLAHLSALRDADDRGERPEWGSEEDRERMVPLIGKAMAKIEGSADLFPDTHEALKRLQG